MWLNWSRVSELTFAYVCINMCHNFFFSKSFRSWSRRLCTVVPQEVYTTFRRMRWDSWAREALMLTAPVINYIYIYIYNENLISWKKPINKSFSGSSQFHFRYFINILLLYIYIYVYICVCVCVCVSACMYVCVRARARVCVCVCTYCKCCIFFYAFKNLLLSDVILFSFFFRLSFSFSFSLSASVSESLILMVILVLYLHIIFSLRKIPHIDLDISSLFMDLFVYYLLIVNLVHFIYRPRHCVHQQRKRLLIFISFQHYPFFFVKFSL